MLQEKTHRTWEEMKRDKWKKKRHAQVLEAQLEAKFGALDDSVRSRLYEASSGDLLLWATRLLEAESLDEIFS